MERRTGLIAHRGFSSHFDENTLAGFEAALAYSPLAIEIDVVVYRGKLYAYHPKNSQGIYGKEVDEVIEQELRLLEREEELEKRLIEPIVRTLIDTTEVRLLLDLKQKSTAVFGDIMDAVKGFRASADQIIVGARDREKLELLQQYRSLCRVLSLSQEPDSYIEFIRGGARIIRLWEDEVTAARVNAIHDLSTDVWVMPCCSTNRGGPGIPGEVTTARLKALAKLGVDGVLVNDIAAAHAILADFYEPR